MKRYCFVFILLVFTGCARLFGWDIHAPGLLSNSFIQQVQTSPQRVALFVPPSFYSYTSTDKGSRWSDPQTYHVGEAMAPMILEAFQASFEEFVFMETIPREDILKRYMIPYLAVVQIKQFNNTMDMKGQKLSVITDILVFDQDLNPVTRFESVGVSDSKKVFAKKGGPEVNLNAAIEKNIFGMVTTLQDFLETK